MGLGYRPASGPVHFLDDGVGDQAVVAVPGEVTVPAGAATDRVGAAGGDGREAGAGVLAASAVYLVMCERQRPARQLDVAGLEVDGSAGGERSPGDERRRG